MTHATTNTLKKITIRPLEARDRVAWERLFRAYIVFYKADVADDVIDDAFHRMLSSDPHDHRCLLAIDEHDQPVGLAHILFHRSTWSKTGYLYLEDLFVDPAVRTGGIGEALVRRVYEEADKLGATRTYWITDEFNDRARSLYDRLATKGAFIHYRR